MSAATVIPLHTHPLARERAAVAGADRYAAQFGLDPVRSARLVADTRALVHAGCSAAWSLTVARRTARRAAANPQLA